MVARIASAYPRSWNATATDLSNNAMLRLSIVFLVLAIIAAAFGFGGSASDIASIAKVLFLLFLSCFVGTLVLGLVSLRRK